jgi:hypothetical protein
VGKSRNDDVAAIACRWSHLELGLVELAGAVVEQPRDEHESGDADRESVFVAGDDKRRSEADQEPRRFA